MRSFKSLVVSSWLENLAEIRSLISNHCSRGSQMLRKPGDEMLSFARWRQLRNDSNLRGRDERMGLFAFGGKQGLSFGSLDWTGGDSHCSPRTFFRLTNPTSTTNPLQVVRHYHIGGHPLPTEVRLIVL